MADPIEFDVMREHLGDKPYKAGDTRTAVAADVSTLVQMRVLRRKVDRPLANKMEPALTNKSAAKPVKKA